MMAISDNKLDEIRKIILQYQKTSKKAGDATLAIIRIENILGLTQSESNSILDPNVKEISDGTKI
jgi:hypothetical protein